jgi:hypothetical protein
MLDAGHEIENLRSKLIVKGIPDYEADEICDNASLSIRDMVIDIVADALEEAVSSDNGNSHNFVQQAMAVRDGALFKITTSSGRSDFSEPPFPMLPKLLSNAKVASDGSRYKRIPMRKKMGESSLPKTIENAVMQINKQREILKEEKKARLEKRRGMASDPMEAIPSIEALPVSHNEHRFNNSESVATEFRTASDKQDANSKWVKPAKQADMTNELDRINNILQDRIDDAIRTVISAYGGSI